MDAQEVARRLGESLSNDDLWTNPGIVDDVEELADGYDALKAENAKLRELVQGLWFAAQYGVINPDGATGIGFARQMRELGVEVEE